MPRRVSREPYLFNKGILSSFYYPCEIELPNPVQVMKGNDVFLSNEHYFHCCKVGVVNHIEYAIETYREIRDASTPQAAKRLGREVPMDEEDIEFWDMQAAPVAMLEANLAKFTTHEHCREFLVKTGRRPLVEHRPDPIWGDNMDGTGLNLLGKILEVVRERVR